MKKHALMFSFVIVIFFLGMINTSASNNLLETKTKNKVMFIKDENGKFSYSWSFNKDEYNKNAFDFDLGISFTSPNEKEIENLIDTDVKKKYVSFNYHGNLPSVATIKVPVDDAFKEGDKLSLYYYNPTTSQIELINSNIKVINGNVSFEIEHCSDYFLTMAVIKNAEDSTNNNGIVIVGMVIVIVGLIGYTLMRNK